MFNKQLYSDSDAHYSQIVNLSVVNLIPQIALPPDIDNVSSVIDIEKKNVSML